MAWLWSERFCCCFEQWNIYLSDFIVQLLLLCVWQRCHIINILAHLNCTIVLSFSHSYSRKKNLLHSIILSAYYMMVQSWANNLLCCKNKSHDQQCQNVFSSCRWCVFFIKAWQIRCWANDWLSCIKKLGPDTATARHGRINLESVLTLGANSSLNGYVDTWFLVFLLWETIFSKEKWQSQ